MCSNRWWCVGGQVEGCRWLQCTGVGGWVVGSGFGEAGCCSGNAVCTSWEEPADLVVRSCMFPVVVAVGYSSLQRPLQRR